MNELPVKITDAAAVLPSRSSASAAGLDLYSCEDVLLSPGRVITVRTGISIEIPAGCAGLVWPRSGMAAKHGIDTMAGVIDSDYRGEVKVVLTNHGTEAYRIKAGDRIAQLIIQKYEALNPVKADTLSDTSRGSGGFGSSGS